MWCGIGTIFCRISVTPHGGVSDIPEPALEPLPEAGADAMARADGLALLV